MDNRTTQLAVPLEGAHVWSGTCQHPRQRKQNNILGNSLLAMDPTRRRAMRTATRERNIVEVKVLLVERMESSF